MELMPKIGAHLSGTSEYCQIAEWLKNSEQQRRLNLLMVIRAFIFHFISTHLIPLESVWHSNVLFLCYFIAIYFLLWNLIFEI
jgi:hypothetical protein